MTVNPIENYYFDLEEPRRGCLLAIREVIKAFHPEIIEVWKYGSPFFSYHGKLVCYFWKDKKTKQPYIGFLRGYLIDDDALIAGNRTMVKILPVDPELDIPVKVIERILKKSLAQIDEK